MLLIILLASIIGSVFALAGGVMLLWKEHIARKFSLTLVSFAAGSLIGAAFLELLPEALELHAYQGIAFAVIAGIVVLFIFEKFLNFYHCHDQDRCEVHSFSGTVLFGDALHNFIDGIVIAGSFLASIPAGIAATTAVFFHEVPQEIGDFGVLLHAGYSKKKVFWYNFAAALTTSAGALIGYFFLNFFEPYLGYVLAFASGSFLYIAVSDLLPELRHHTKRADIGHLITVVLGVLVIVAVGMVFPE